MNKKRSFRRITCAVLAVLFFIVEIPVSVKAEVYWPEGPQINTPSAIVMEVNSGAVLYEKNSDEVNYPASITKILTTLVALENSEMDEIVTFSNDAINNTPRDSSHIARDYGEQMTMKDCLYGIMLESANECAYAVAEHIGKKLGGDYQTFINLMNEKAKELGCTNTQFTNANGLPDTNHFTSARDMALISAEAYRNEAFRTITGTRNYRIAPTNKHSEETPLNNHHSMMNYYKTRKYLYEYCTGGKTGYTVASGSTLVTFAEKDGLKLVCVVMHTNSTDQYLDTTALFDYCFQNFQTVSLAENQGALKTDKSMGIMNHHSSFVEIRDGAGVILPVMADFQDLQQTVIEEELPEGVIARLQYAYGDHMVGCVELVPSNAVVEEDYFAYAGTIEESTEVTGQENTATVIKVKPIYVLYGLAGIASVVSLFAAIKYFIDHYYVILHDIRRKKERKRQLRPARQKKKRWTKKDSMFK